MKPEFTSKSCKNIPFCGYFTPQNVYLWLFENLLKKRVFFLLPINTHGVNGCLETHQRQPTLSLLGRGGL